MSPIELSSNFRRKVIPSLSYQRAFHKLGSSEPSSIAVFERGLETRKKQLNSAILISSKRSHFGFMSMTSDLTGRVYEDVKSSGPSFSEISAWEQPLCA